MQKKTFSFSTSRTTCYFEASFSQINKVVEKERCIFITDQHVYDPHKKYFKGSKLIEFLPGNLIKSSKPLIRSLISSLNMVPTVKRALSVWAAEW